MHCFDSYDISKPTEVILSFDDSDDEESSNYNFIENTTNNDFPKYIETGNAVWNRDSEKYKNELKITTQKTNDIDPNTIKCNEKNINAKNLSEESKRYIDYPHREINKLLVETEIIEDKIRNSLDESNLLETKKRRHCEPTAKLAEKVIKLEPQKVQELCIDVSPPEIETQESPCPTHEAHEFVYVNKLLYRVSESLLFIIKAFSLHMSVQNSNEEQNQIDKSMTNFLSFKYKLFKLCFVIVENIMVPNAGKELFVKQFIADTIKLGCEKNIVSTYHQIESILKEMLAWTANNSLNNTKLTVEEVLNNHKVETNKPIYSNNLLLKNQLESPSKDPNINLHPEVNPMQLRPIKNTINAVSKSRVNSNFSQPQKYFTAAPSPNSLPSVHKNNTYPLMHRNYGVMPKNVPNNLRKTINDKVLINLENDVNLNSITPSSGQPTSNVLFSTGPPGQEVSITIEHSVLKQQLQQRSANITPYHTTNCTVIQKPSNLHQQRENSAQLYPQNWHQQQLPQQKLPQQQLPQQQFPQLQTPPQHLPLHATPQQYLPHNHSTNQRNQDPRCSNQFIVTQPPEAYPYYPRNVLHQKKVPPPPPYWQHQLSKLPTCTPQHPSAFPHLLPLGYRTPEQNEQRIQPEIIRSSSNDSGFTSPLNFNSPAPTNAQVIFNCIF